MARPESRTAANKTAVAHITRELRLGRQFRVDELRQECREKRDRFRMVSATAAPPKKSHSEIWRKNDKFPALRHVPMPIQTRYAPRTESRQRQ